MYLRNALKNLYLIVFIIFGLHATIEGQTMEWEFLPAGTMIGSHTTSTDCSADRLCFGLRYVPNTDGVMTSYTTGFIGSCNGAASPVLSSQSLVMTDNSSSFDGCSNPVSGFVIFASGNTGNVAVTTGNEIILHELCLRITPTQSVTLVEEDVTDLTVSIDLPSPPGGAIDEKPDFPGFSADNDEETCNPVVPVTYKDFTVDLVNRTAWLTWSTEEERQNFGFFIEHAQDGRNWEEIGFESARNDGQYQFPHPNRREGYHYYRLRQVDNDGSIEYSSIQFVHVGPSATTPQGIFPNPVTDWLNIEGIVNAPATYRLLSINGRIIEEGILTEAPFRINVKPLVNGLYLCEIQSDAGTQVHRLVKW